MTDSALALLGVGVAVLVVVVVVFAGRWLSRFLRKRAALADRLVVARVAAEHDRVALEYLARYRVAVGSSVLSVSAYRPAVSPVSSASAQFRATGHFVSDGSDGFER